MQKKYLLLTVFVFILSCLESTKITTVRPIRLRVVDAYSGNPLSNITVYRIVDAYENINTMLFGILPRPEPKRKDRIVITESAITDENGYVHFVKKEVILREREDLLREKIIINLIVNRICKFQKNENLFLILYDCFFEPISCDRCVENINKKYKGAYVLSPCYEFIPEDYKFSETVHFSWIRINKGILKPSENIVIKLKHYDGKPVKYDTSESDKKVLEFKKAWKEYKKKKYQNIEN